MKKFFGFILAVVLFVGFYLWENYTFPNIGDRVDDSIGMNVHEKLRQNTGKFLVNTRIRKKQFFNWIDNPAPNLNKGIQERTVEGEEKITESK